jgi:hypothetical protein
VNPGQYKVKGRERQGEDVLHERIDGSVDPEHFVGVLEQLLAQGQVGVHVDRDPPVNRPRPARPFEARYWYLTPS